MRRWLTALIGLFAMLGAACSGAADLPEGDSQAARAVDPRAEPALASTETPPREPVAPAVSGLEGGLGGRVYVVERSSARLAVYDFVQRRLLPGRVSGLGDMHHATMTFTPDLRYGFVATRNGVLTRIDLETAKAAGEVKTSENSIDLAIGQDGRHIAIAEYIPGGVSIVDVETLEVAKRIPATAKGVRGERDSRVTGMVDAPGNKFVCTLIEGREVWVIDASKPEFPIEHRIALPEDVGLPYDAMITPDGRHYLVGHLGKAEVSVIDLRKSPPEARLISLADPYEEFAVDTPVKLPHMASWAVAGEHVFVPLVGEPRLAVLDRDTFAFERSLQLRGHPVYAVRSPSEREIWVSFSGEDDDAFVQVVDTERLEVTDTMEIGGRIYHMDFTPRGAYALISANRANKLVLVDANSHQVVDEQPLDSPSGLFGVWRAFRIGL